MSFSVRISGVTIGWSILNVDIQACSDINGSVGCTTVATNVPRAGFPMFVDVPDNTYSVKLVASNINDGENSSGNLCSPSPLIIALSNRPTPTPTATPTPTPTPTPTATPTPTPTATPTPTPTGVVVTATPTPTPTAVPLPGCGDIVEGTYSGADLHNYGDYELDLSEASNGTTISFVCTANDRPNNITVKTNTGTVATTAWFGNSSGYDSGDYWYPTEGTGPVTLTITYDNTKTYSINVLTAPRLSPPNDLDDNWSVNIQCLGVATPTPTPLPTTKYIVKKCASSGGDGVTTYKISASLITTGKTYTFVSGPGGLADMNGANCWDVISSVTDSTSPDYVVPSYNAEYVSCGMCGPVSFSTYSGVTPSIACNQTNPVTVYYRGTLGEGTVLYTASNLLTPVSFGYYYYDITTIFGVLNTEAHPSVEDGAINYTTVCPPTPTPTPLPTYEFTVYVSDSDGDSACNGGNAPGYPVYTAFVITGDTTDLCTSNSFSCYFIPTFDYDTFWVSNGTVSRKLTRTGPNGSIDAVPYNNATCVNCGPTPTPTPLPITPTPTPTGAPTGDGCIQITEYNSQDTTECLLNNVPYYYTTITALLTDGSGNPVNAAGDVSAYVNITENILYQQEHTSDVEIKILNGTSSANITIVTSIPVDNGQGNCENETRVINGYSAQSGYSICTP